MIILGEEKELQTQFNQMKERFINYGMVVSKEPDLINLESSD